jgi:hypothetical protein
MKNGSPPSANGDEPYDLRRCERPAQKLANVENRNLSCCRARNCPAEDEPVTFLGAQVDPDAPIYRL